MPVYDNWRNQQESEKKKYYRIVDPRTNNVFVRAGRAGSGEKIIWNSISTAKNSLRQYWSASIAVSTTAAGTQLSVRTASDSTRDAIKSYVEELQTVLTWCHGSDIRIDNIMEHGVTVWLNSFKYEEVYIHAKTK